VILESFCGNVRSQSILCERKGGERKGHVVSVLSTVVDGTGELEKCCVILVRSLEGQAKQYNPTQPEIVIRISACR
jgi:hypothetical protein